MKGIIFNIERYAIHDGPGIRTLVFLKGCPLRCLWCANPESQCIFPQLIYFSNKCTGCGSCILVCPNEAIKVDKGKIIMEWDKCKNCLKCVEVCPGSAKDYRGNYVTPEEVLAEVLKDIPFYKRSNGGVTLGGGEPLMQSDFATQILRLCKENYINTAIETSGYANEKDLDKVLDYTDLVFFDIKQMDSEKHKTGTGVENEKILKNAKRVSNKGIPIIIRIPIIPGYNDSVENISNTAKFARELNSLIKVELLPYHKLGVSKYEHIGEKYLLADMVPPNSENLKRLESIVRSYGLKCNTL